MLYDTEILAKIDHSKNEFDWNSLDELSPRTQNWVEKRRKTVFRVEKLFLGSNLEILLWHGKIDHFHGLKNELHLIFPWRAKNRTQNWVEKRRKTVFRVEKLFLGSNLEILLWHGKIDHFHGLKNEFDWKLPWRPISEGSKNVEKRRKTSKNRF